MTYALLLAGGYGIRLWPMSRLKRPKQFLRLDGKKNMVQVTVDRVGRIISKKNIYVVTLASQRRRFRKELPSLNPSQLIGEPTGKNTAAAIALGTAKILRLRRDPEATICVFPCDHWIGGESSFQQSLKKAITRAKTGKSIILFGIKPSRPETGYGYLEFASGRDGVYPVRRFIEKPSPTRANSLLRSKKILWNSGIFIFKASFLLNLFQKTLPKTAKIFSIVSKSPNNQKALSSLYRMLPPISFDVGLLERSKDIECIKAPFGWEDVGFWLNLYRRISPDPCENRSWGSVFPLESFRNLIISDRKHLVGTFGISNLAIIHTPEITFICTRKRLGQLRGFLEKLKKVRRFRSYL